MFGIGGTELLIILVFVFIVVGPDKLPEVATMIGKAIRKFQDAQSEVNKVIKTETADIKKAINSDAAAPARKPAATSASVAPVKRVEKPKADAEKPAEEAAQAAPEAEAAAEERPLSFSERKAQYQRERKEREEAERRAKAAAAQTGKGE